MENSTQKPLNSKHGIMSEIGKWACLTIAASFLLLMFYDAFASSDKKEIVRSINIQLSMIDQYKDDYVQIDTLEADEIKRHEERMRELRGGKVEISTQANEARENVKSLCNQAEFTDLKDCIGDMRYDFYFGQK